LSDRLCFLFSKSSTKNDAPPILHGLHLVVFAAEISLSRMKVTSSTQRDRVKSAEKTKSDGGDLKNKGWRKAVEEDGSQVSDLSDSTDDGVEEDESLGERSEDYENFEKTLRSKHSKACKAMSVRGLSLV